MAGLDLTEGAILTALAAGAGYAGRLIETIIKGRPSKKDLLTAAGEMAQGLMDGMREDLDALRAEVRAIKASHAECEARCEMLSGEVRSLRQSNDSLIRQLRDPSSTAPGGPLEGAVIQLSGGAAEVVSTKAEREGK